MKISSGGMQITTSHTILTAGDGGSTANKSSSGPDPITVTINMLDDTYIDRVNSDGNYYGIVFPGDYIGERGTSKDPFYTAGARTGTDPIDYAGTLNVILNIPAGMKIGANTSGNFGSQTLGGSGTFSGAKYELSLIHI